MNSLRPLADFITMYMKRSTTMAAAMPPAARMIHMKMKPVSLGAKPWMIILITPIESLLV